MKSHELVDALPFDSIRYEHRPVKDREGKDVDGLHAMWIRLDTPAQLNSYTTDAVKELILAFRRASVDRAAVAVVFTATGERAFCSGGNTAEYAEVYAGRPQEYRQYMRLFNDMVSGILSCDKPVINRVNRLRIAGGQEIGMACDFTRWRPGALRAGRSEARLGPGRRLDGLPARLLKARRWWSSKKLIQHSEYLVFSAGGGPTRRRMTDASC